MMGAVILYRPVGTKELGLIEASGWRAFPPRLPEQPIFYPVTNEAYAVQIARDWNARHNDDLRGYVTRFAVGAGFLSGYRREVVGGREHEEYWIPAEDLPAFNAALIGTIEVVAAFAGDMDGVVTGADRQIDVALTPFPLEGGRAGDEGVARDLDHRPARGGVLKARRLRREATTAERLLWAELRKSNAKFRRQAPIGPYIADFVHHGSQLVIEIDGYHHTLPEQQAHDLTRTTWLNSKGYRVIRFDEADVRRDAAAVTAQILAETVSPSSQTLLPSREKGLPAPDLDPTRA